MEDERRPVRTQRPTEVGPAADRPLPDLPARPEPDVEPDDEVVPDGRFEPL